MQVTKRSSEKWKENVCNYCQSKLHNGDARSAIRVEKKKDGQRTEVDKVQRADSLLSYPAIGWNFCNL